MEGLAYIKDNASESDAHNDQYAWILPNIKEVSETPIAGWPETKVRIMAQKRIQGIERGFAARVSFDSKSFTAWMAWCG